MKRLLSLLTFLSVMLSPWVSAETLFLNTLWQKKAGDYDWLGINHTERGMAYNPVTHHILVAAREGGPSIRVLDADTGDYIGSLSMTGVSGGNFPINKIGVADDGAIYVGNMTVDANSTTDPGPFKLYRWADESSEPVVVFSGHPGDGAASPNHRFGDSLAIRGAGENTEILLGTWDGTILSLLTPGSADLDEPESFVSQVITTNVLPQHGRNLVFGDGNIIYMTRPTHEGSPGHLYEVELDLTAGTGTSLRMFDGGAIARGLGPIGLDTASNLLAGVRPFSHDIYVFLYSELGAQATTYPSWEAGFESTNSNGNGTGELIIVGNRIYGLHTNNGILALELGAPQGVPPGEIFWTNAGAVRTAELNGDNPRTVRGGLNRAIGIAIDPVRHHIYYADNPEGVIARMDLDGRNHEEVLTGRVGPQFLKIHEDKLYWAEWDEGLFRSDLNGSNIEPLITLGAGSQSTAVLVGPDGLVYLGSAAGQLYRPTQDPAAPDLVMSYASGTFGLVAHPTNNTIYATSFDNNQVFSINFSTGQETWLNYQHRPLGIDLTQDGTQFVWAERTDGAIRISGIGGSASITTLVSGEDSPFGVVVLPELSELPQGFAGWIGEFNLPSDQQGPQDDPDGDGLPNLLEYALGGDPSVPNSGLLPVTGFEADGENDYLALAIAKNPDATGISYIVEISSDLVVWESGEEHLLVIDEDDTTLLVRDLLPLSSENKRFIRLRVELD